MITVEEALDIIYEQSIPVENSVLKEIMSAVTYTLSEDLYAPIDMPPFRQSAMDGYALHLHNSNNYAIIDEIKAGDDHNPTLNSGEAVRIFTGARVPTTANSIAIQENTKVENKKLELMVPTNLGDHIRHRGEQVKKGTVALKKGTFLTAAAVGFLSSLGVEKVNVFKKPTIAVLTTGNELIEIGKSLTASEIYESNSNMLLSALKEIHFNHSSVYKIKDNYEHTVTKLNQAIENHDVVLITGGISVGDYDFVGKALVALNVKQLFFKVKQKPGKPIFFGKKDNTYVFALPGNPAASLSCFYLYVFPTLMRLSGNMSFRLKKSFARCNTPYHKKGARSQFLKGVLKDGKVSILEGQSSAMLHTFAMANVLIYIPENRPEISVDDLVEIIHLPI